MQNTLFLKYLWIGIMLFLSGVVCAQESEIPQTSPFQKPPSAFPEIPEPDMPEETMDDRSMESKMLVPDPEFFHRQTASRQQGMYYGAGFRDVIAEFISGNTVRNRNLSGNGVAYNLGYVSSGQIFEYSRHVSFLDIDEGLDFKGVTYNRVEYIQNNFWFAYAPLLLPDWFPFYGAALQTSQIRAFDDVNGEEKLVNESALAIGVGFGYYVTSNFLIQYRLTQSHYSPLLTGPGVDILLKESQLHTLFLEYYFAL